jgi:hypothetical protein
MHALERFPDAEWPNLLVVVRDTTISTSKGGGDRVEVSAGSMAITSLFQFQNTEFLHTC